MAPRANRVRHSLPNFGGNHENRTMAWKLRCARAKARAAALIECSWLSGCCGPRYQPRAVPVKPVLGHELKLSIGGRQRSLERRMEKIADGTLGLSFRV
jgi:hypothetical protein